MVRRRLSDELSMFSSSVPAASITRMFNTCKHKIVFLRIVNEVLSWQCDRFHFGHRRHYGLCSWSFSHSRTVRTYVYITTRWRIRIWRILISVKTDIWKSSVISSTDHFWYRCTLSRYNLNGSKFSSVTMSRHVRRSVISVKVLGV